jgi:NADH-quinone oxidoreductase subunit A
MPDAIASSLGIVAYLALFAAVGILFVLVNLVIGRFVRPSDPHPEKLEIYECGEPTIGSSFVQFDLRFYVVALLFIIFDVEVAFFFPWATVFGKANHLADTRPANAVVEQVGDGFVLTDQAEAIYQEMGIREPAVPTEIPASLVAKVSADATPMEQASQTIRQGARQLALVTLVDIGVFFAVLLVGFAYVWKRGDLDWVRAVSQERSRGAPRTLAPVDSTLEQALSA